MQTKMQNLFTPRISRFLLIRLLFTFAETTAAITEEANNTSVTTDFTTFGTFNSSVEDGISEREVCEAGKSGYECFIKQLLISNTNMYLRPHFEGPPVNNTCNIFISSISEINEASMDYQVGLFLHQRWNDERLMHNYNTITLQSVDLINRIWRPDIYFDNEKSAIAHKVTMDNVAMNIEPNGDIFYSMRLTLKLFCNMDLKRFPFDSHMCPMILLSYAYNSEELALKWPNEDAVTFFTYYQLPQFSLEKIVTSQYDKDYGVFFWSFLEADFYWTRQKGYFILQNYIPSGLLVSMSWISFWLHADATPARTVLGITTILTITTQSAWARESLPQVSYATAIDVWMAVCVCFVFCALLEFAAVNFIHGWTVAKEKKTERQRERIKNIMQNISVAMLCQPTTPNKIEEGSNANGKNPCKNNELEVQRGENNNQGKGEQEKQKKRNMPNAVDRVSRILFPSAFLFFNTVYWWFYLT